MRQDALDSGAGAQAQSRDMDIFDLARMWLSHWKALLTAALLVAGVAHGVSWLIPPTYTSYTTILAPQQSQSAASALLGSLSGMAGMPAGALGGLKNPADQWVGLLRSRTVADAVLKKFDLRKVYDTDYDDLARRTLAGSTRIVTGKDGLITIDVDDEDPQRAAAMANEYVDQLQLLSKRLAVTEAAQRRLFLERQLAEVRTGLARAEAGLRKGGMSASILKATPSAAVAELAQLKAQIAAQEIKVSVMAGYLTGANAELQQAQQMLAALRKQLKDREQVDADGGQGDGYIDNYRELKYQETLYELVAKQYEMARADEAKEGAVIQIVDRAVPPELKSSPKRMRITVVAFVLGLMAAMAGLMIRDRWREAQRGRGPAVQ